MILLLVPLISFVSAACPPGYSYYNMTLKCYTVYNDASPFFAASETCRSDGGWLVSIHNAFENSYIADLVSSSNLNHWIGLTNMISGYEFEWLDNTPVQYSNWIPGEPNYDTSCVFMEADSGYWASNNCRDFLPFICEYDPAVLHQNCPSVATQAPCPVSTTCPPPITCPTAPPSTPPPKPKCDPGWRYYDYTDFCYYAGNDEMVNDAVNACSQKGSYLASIHSAEENSFIQNYAYSVNTTNSILSVWIGLYRTGPNSTDFANYDGTPVDYTHWNSGEPNNARGVEYCSEMIIHYLNDPDGYWNDVNCEEPLSIIGFYACKKPSNK